MKKVFLLMIATGAMLCNQACSTKRAVQKNAVTQKKDVITNLIKRDSSTADTVVKTRFALTRPDEEGFYDYVDAYYQDMKKDIFTVYDPRNKVFFINQNTLYAPSINGLTFYNHEAGDVFKSFVDPKGPGYASFQKAVENGHTMVIGYEEENSKDVKPRKSKAYELYIDQKGFLYTLDKCGLHGDHFSRPSKPLTNKI